MNLSTHPDAVKHKGEALSGKPVPVAERVHHGPLRANTQLSGVKQTRRQIQQSLVRAVVIHQLRHLQNNKEKYIIQERAGLETESGTWIIRINIKLGFPGLVEWVSCNEGKLNSPNWGNLCHFKCANTLWFFLKCFYWFHFKLCQTFLLELLEDKNLQLPTDKIILILELV